MSGSLAVALRLKVRFALVRTTNWFCEFSGTHLSPLDVYANFISAPGRGFKGLAQIATSSRNE
jgi:hypothetical protein